MPIFIVSHLRLSIVDMALPDSEAFITSCPSLCTSPSSHKPWAWHHSGHTEPIKAPLYISKHEAGPVKPPIQSFYSQSCSTETRELDQVGNRWKERVSGCDTGEAPSLCMSVRLPWFLSISQRGDLQKQAPNPAIRNFLPSDWYPSVKGKVKFRLHLEKNVLVGSLATSDIYDMVAI